MKSYKLSQIQYKRILGRNVKNAGNDDCPLALFWGASALEVNVKSCEIWALLSSDYDEHEPWVSIEVNGFQTARFMIPKGEPCWYCLARNLNKENENLISIIKDTQPMSGEAKHSLFIHEIGLCDKGSFCKLKERNLNIEFIGDSITSGEGLAGSPFEQDWITQWFCASKTYAVQTAKALNANYSVLSQCGWGICWGWDGNVNSALPPHYENVCSVMWGDYQKKIGAQDVYDFSVRNDFVILNLGTNDNGAFFQPAWKDQNGIEHILKMDKNEQALPEYGTIIQNEVKNFLKKIRNHNPDAKIIWTWGMINLHTVTSFIAAGIEEYKKESGDKKVFSLELDSMEDLEVLPEDKGSRGHPGPKTHRQAAIKLVDFINKI